MATDEFSAAAARQQASALLPQKYPTWQDAAGTVRLAYNAADL